MDLIQQLEQLRLEWDTLGFDSTAEQWVESYYGNQMLNQCLEIVKNWLDQEGYIQ